MKYGLRFMVIAGAAAILTFFPSLLHAEELPNADETPQCVTLTLTDDPRTTQTISWRTSDGYPEGFVQYAKVTSKGFSPLDGKTIVALSQAMPEEAVIMHKVTLTGLEPGTRYAYRVGNYKEWSGWKEFMTAAKEADGFKFLVFTDSQSEQYDLWQDVLHKAYAANPDAKFLTVVGDLVNVGSDYDEWKSWFKASAGVIDAIPVMPLIGNHETYTPVIGERTCPKLFTAQFNLPDNGPEGLTGQVYSFDYGNAHFVMLDSQVQEQASFMPDMLERQKAWLEQDLAATNKKWKIVFFHKPPYPNKSSRGHRHTPTAFGPILDNYHVDVVINGHEHVYSRTYPLFGNEIVDSRRGIVYVTAGRSGDESHEGITAGEWSEFFYNPVDEPSYLTVEIKDDILTVKAFKHSGAVLEAWNIDKSK